MSKAELVITAVVLEGRTHAEVAAQYGLSRSWVTRLVKRYREEGKTAFEPRSRRPHTSPSRVGDVLNEQIVNLRETLTKQGLDAGPETIRWHLQQHHDITVSISTIRRRLITAGLVKPEPKKRPKTSYIRFEADLPNGCWQTDFTHIWLADGTNTGTITFLDDHSRYALNVTTHLRVTGPIVNNQFLQTIEKHGIPASVLSDNGMVYTTRFAGGKGGRNGFENTLRSLDIIQKNSRPNHPTTCGKVERFQQTMKKWTTARPAAKTIQELQHNIDEFVHNYNNHRPHRSLNRATPHTAYTRLPKDQPGGSTTGPHHRIRHDRIDKSGTVTLRHAGKLHHIGIGRPHAQTQVIILAQDLDIRIVATQTGELLRHLTLNPNTDYQPRHKT